MKFTSDFLVPTEDAVNKENSFIEERNQIYINQICKTYSILIFLILGVIMGLLVVAYHIFKMNSFSWQIIRPVSDIKTYKMFDLKNDMRVLVIHDPDTEVSGISLNIGLGYYNEQEKFSGITKLIQLALTKGSHKYPNENFFLDFLSNNGGSYSTHTSNEDTSFTYTTRKKVFEISLDIFSSYLMDPTLSKEVLEKSFNLIKADVENNLNTDTGKETYMLKLLGNPKHPFSRVPFIQMKNYKTSAKAKGIESEAMNYFRKYFSSNVMKLVIYSSYPMDKVEKWVKTYFSKIKNNRLDNYQDQIPRPFLIESLGTYSIYNSTIDAKTFSIYTKHEETFMRFKEKPLDYLNYHLNYEGKDSFKASLIKKSLITNLVASIHTRATDFTLSQIKFTLTEKGELSVNEILKEFYAYIVYLRQNLDSASYDNLHQITDLSFKYNSVTNINEFLKKTSFNMQHFRKEYAIVGDSVFEIYNEVLINNYIKDFTLQNAIIVFSSEIGYNSMRTAIIDKFSKSKEFSSFRFARREDNIVPTKKQVTSTKDSNTLSLQKIEPIIEPEIEEFLKRKIEGSYNFTTVFADVMNNVYKIQYKLDYFPEDFAQDFAQAAIDNTKKDQYPQINWSKHFPQSFALLPECQMNSFIFMSKANSKFGNESYNSMKLFNYSIPTKAAQKTESNKTNYELNSSIPTPLPSLPKDNKYPKLINRQNSFVPSQNNSLLASIFSINKSQEIIKNPDEKIALDQFEDSLLNSIASSISDDSIKANNPDFFKLKETNESFYNSTSNRSKAISKEDLMEKALKDYFKKFQEEEDNNSFGISFLQTKSKITLSNESSIQGKGNEKKIFRLMATKEIFENKDGEGLMCSNQRLINDKELYRPNLIFNETNFQIWHSLDRSFLQPKTAIHVFFYSAISWKSAENFFSTTILASLLNFEFNQYFNDIKKLGGILDFQGSIAGIELYLETFSDRFEEVLVSIINQLNTLEISNDVFNIAKVEAIAHLDLSFNTAYNKGTLKSLIKNVYYGADKLKAVENTIDLPSLMKFKIEFLETTSVMTFIHGNILNNCSFNTVKASFSNFNIPSTPVETYPRDVRSFNGKSFVFRQKSNQKYSIIQNYYQFSVRSIESLAKFSIILELMQVEMFKVFKNEQKIALRIDYASEGNIDAFLVSGVSNAISPDEMNSKIEEFLYKFEGYLKDIQPYEFLIKKEEIISMLKEGDKSIFEKGSKIWNEIKLKSYEFEKKQTMIRIITNLKIEESIEFFKANFKMGAGKMSIQLFGNGHEMEKPLLPAAHNYIGIDEIEIKPK